jgi:hypothetical protein
MKEPISFLYTNNKRCGSKLISWATRDHGQLVSETPSHFSILLYDWLVIESTIAYGLAPKLFAKFKEHNTIIAQFAPKTDKKRAVEIAKNMANRNHSAKYDYAGALYLGWHAMMRFNFKRPLPKTNRFDSAKDFFCNEIYKDLYGGDVSMKHPNWLMKDMMKDERLLRLA